MQLDLSLTNTTLGKASNFALLSKVQEAIPSSDIMPL